MSGGADMHLDLGLVEEASQFLRGRVRHTPLDPSPALSALLGVDTWLKLEHLQLTGSFKVRGALFRLARLTDAERAAGVVTASAGNHGKGIAYAARELGIDAEIHVPATVDESKYAGMLALGATVVRSSAPGYDDTELEARAAAAAGDRVFVSAFDDPAVMAGNGGSLAHELLADLPATGTVIFPVGGGGLGAGIALTLRPDPGGDTGPRLVAVQTESSPALALSLERGHAVTRFPPAETLAGGVEGGIGANTFPVLRDRIDHVALVSEPAIAEAVRWLVAEHQTLVEPTAAVAVAACLSGRLPPLPGPVVVVLSGRNVALKTVSSLLG